MTVKQHMLRTLYQDLSLSRDRIEIAEENVETAKSEYHRAVDRFNEINDLIEVLENE